MNSPATVFLLARAKEIAAASGHPQVHFLDFLLALVESDSTKALFAKVGEDQPLAVSNLQRLQKVVAYNAEDAPQALPPLSDGVADIVQVANQCAGEGETTPELLWRMVVSEDNWRVARLINSLPLPIDSLRNYFLE